MRSIERLPETDGNGTGIDRTTIPGGATRVAHLGTFNGNPLSMAAGVVTLTQILTRDAYPELHRLAGRLTEAGALESLRVPSGELTAGSEVASPAAL